MCGARAGESGRVTHRWIRKVKANKHSRRCYTNKYMQSENIHGPSVPAPERAAAHHVYGKNADTFVGRLTAAEFPSAYLKLTRYFFSTLRRTAALLCVADTFVIGRPKKSTATCATVPYQQR